jgi:hypothetical protein
MIWDEDPIRLREQVGRIRARTTLLGVDESLITELEGAAMACWRRGTRRSTTRPAYHAAG